MAGDWAFIPSSWKAVGDEDPGSAFRPPTTARCSWPGRPPSTTSAPFRGAWRQSFAGSWAPSNPDPGGRPRVDHPHKLLGDLGHHHRRRTVSAKFKYGGNVDEAHRLAVVERLGGRGGPGDAAAAGHVLRRLDVAPL